MKKLLHCDICRHNNVTDCVFECFCCCNYSAEEDDGESGDTFESQFPQLQYPEVTFDEI